MSYLGQKLLKAREKYSYVLIRLNIFLWNIVFLFNMFVGLLIVRQYTLVEQGIDRVLNLSAAIRQVSKVVLGTYLLYHHYFIYVF